MSRKKWIFAILATLLLTVLCTALTIHRLRGYLRLLEEARTNTSENLAFLYTPEKQRKSLFSVLAYAAGALLCPLGLVSIARKRGFAYHNAGTYVTLVGALMGLLRGIGTQDRLSIVLTSVVVGCGILLVLAYLRFGPSGTAPPSPSEVPRL